MSTNRRDFLKLGTLAGTSLAFKPFPNIAKPNISGNNYRFVVIGDLTGGEEPGVFDMAIERINDLAPDFVISVGDLIEGYTLNPDIVNKQCDKFESSLIIENKGEFPLQVKGHFVEKQGCVFEPSEINEKLAAGETKKIPVSMKTETMLYMEDISFPELLLVGKFLQPGKNLTARLPLKWTIDNWKKSKCYDPNQPYSKEQLPGHVDEGWDWHGMADGTFKYRVSNDDKHVFIDVKTVDDVLISENDLSVVQDKITLYLQADPAKSTKDFMKIECWANGETRMAGNALKTKDVKVACGSEGESVWASVKFPRKEVKGNSFRLNFSFTDPDDRINIDPSVLWWKPNWESGRNYPGSGIFILNN